MQETVTIQNMSAQGFEVILKSGLGFTHKWLKAGETMTAPKQSLTDLVLELKRRNILEIN
jgi:hypothetical protein